MKTEDVSFVSSRRGWGAIGLVLLMSYLIIRIQGAPDFATATPPVPAATSSRSIASAPRHHQLPFAAEPNAPNWTPERILQTTGAHAIRGRSVRFYADTVLDHKSSFALRMNLFPDAIVTAVFQAPSVLDTNSDLYVGTIEGDADGEFRIFIKDDKISGTLQAFHRHYQLITLENGSILIAEL